MASPINNVAQATAIDSISSLASTDFSLGNCQVLQYNPPLPGTAQLFPDNYLSALYSRMKASLTLERTMCGMLNLSHDAIVSYLASKPLFAAIEWDQYHTRFQTLGFGFIVAWIGPPPSTPGERSAMGGYSMFPESWGSPEAEVLAMLGIARMFHTYSLQSLYGQRYIRNALTARFMQRFGFKDLATLPDFMPHRNGNSNGPSLAPCVVSRLSRLDLNDYVARQMASI